MRFLLFWGLSRQVIGGGIDKRAAVTYLKCWLTSEETSHELQLYADHKVPALQVAVQLEYDLGVYFFSVGEFESAQAHFGACSARLGKISFTDTPLEPSFVEFTPAELSGYLLAVEPGRSPAATPDPLPALRALATLESSLQQASTASLKVDEAIIPIECHQAVALHGSTYFSVLSYAPLLLSLFHNANALPLILRHIVAQLLLPVAMRALVEHRPVPAKFWDALRVADLGICRAEVQRGSVFAKLNMGGSP